MNPCKTREELDALYDRTYPGAGQGRRANHVGQLWSFLRRIAVDDLVILPRKRSAVVSVGRVTGAYRFRPEFPRCPHTLPVEWLRTDIARSTVDQDLLYSLGAFMTVCQIERNDAEGRVRRMIGQVVGPGPGPEAGPNGGSSGGDPEGPMDIEQLARDQLSLHVIQKFKGHGMARLVDAVLKVEGYLTHVSEPGADGGVDILAGSGPLGLSGPRLCVQVKSQESPADVTVLRTLLGTMQTFQADQGLLVCWGGYKKSVLSEARQSFFKVRLWDAGDLVDALLRNYDRFDEDLRAELPLKRVWALVQEEE